MTSWKPVLFAHFLNAELLRTVAPYKNEKQECWTLNSVNHGRNCRHLCLPTHQISEAPNGKATGSCDELQQSHPLLIVHLLNKLMKHLCKNTNLITKCTFLNENYAINRLYLPEPQDLFAASSIVSVNSVSLPVNQVDLLHPTQHHLHGSHKVLKMHTQHSWACFTFVPCSVENILNLQWKTYL